MTGLPKYSELELFSILADDTALPNGIDEYSYETRIKQTKLNWKVNPFLFHSKLISEILDESSSNIIRRIGYLNWIVVALIVAFSLYYNHHMLLLILLLYSFFTGSGMLDNSIILILGIIVSLLSFKFTNVYFISVFIVFMLAYFISKVQFELFKKKIWRMAFSNF